ncbi:hypothetical protein P154DRAFT_617267 [Amniculicola lignicola CBS 123094]|uniref:Uncharacterized protein n=1 Tax=Amniculicola lignicola CBS 123094 TaxID=1392246 RepID=A0A6A5WSS1_9PLEO|nr:hypothetical protein P154DRAFT_617267 [Amniculicola lignicola CBS 123094]
MGRDLGSGILDGLPFRILLSTPTNWPKYARDKMVEAAEKAGLKHRAGPLSTELIVLSAAEAQGIAATHRFRPPAPDIGEVVIFCGVRDYILEIVTYRIGEPDQTVSGMYQEDMILPPRESVVTDDRFGQLVHILLGRDDLSDFAISVQHNVMNVWKSNLEYACATDFLELALCLPREVLVEIRRQKTKANISKQLKGDYCRLARHDLDIIYMNVTKQIMDILNKQLKKVEEAQHKRPVMLLLSIDLRFMHPSLQADPRMADIRVECIDHLRQLSLVARGAVLKGCAVDGIYGGLLPTVVSTDMAHYVKAPWG